MTEKELAIDMAKELNFDSASFVCKWEQNNVYVCDYTDDTLRFIGYPCYLLIHDSNLRLATDKETEVIMNM